MYYHHCSVLSMSNIQGFRVLRVMGKSTSRHFSVRSTTFLELTLSAASDPAGDGESLTLSVGWQHGNK